MPSQRERIASSAIFSPPSLLPPPPPPRFLLPHTGPISSSSSSPPPASSPRVDPCQHQHQQQQQKALSSAQLPSLSPPPTYRASVIDHRDRQPEPEGVQTRTGSRERDHSVSTSAVSSGGVAFGPYLKSNSEAHEEEPGKNHRHSRQQRQDRHHQRHHHPHRQTLSSTSASSSRPLLLSSTGFSFFSSSCSRSTVDAREVRLQGDRIESLRERQSSAMSGASTNANATTVGIGGAGLPGIYHRPPTPYYPNSASSAALSIYVEDDENRSITDPPVPFQESADHEHERNHRHRHLEADTTGTTTTSKSTNASKPSIQKEYSFPDPFVAKEELKRLREANPGHRAVGNKLSKRRGLALSRVGKTANEDENERGGKKEDQPICGNVEQVMQGSYIGQIAEAQGHLQADEEPIRETNNDETVETTKSDRRRRDNAEVIRPLAEGGRRSRPMHRQYTSDGLRPSLRGIGKDNSLSSWRIGAGGGSNEAHAMPTDGHGGAGSGWGIPRRFSMSLKNNKPLPPLPGIGGLGGLVGGMTRARLRPYPGRSQTMPPPPRFLPQHLNCELDFEPRGPQGPFEVGPAIGIVAGGVAPEVASEKEGRTRSTSRFLLSSLRRSLPPLVTGDRGRSGYPRERALDDNHQQGPSSAPDEYHRPEPRLVPPMPLPTNLVQAPTENLNKYLRHAVPAKWEKWIDPASLALTGTDGRWAQRPVWSPTGDHVGGGKARFRHGRSGSRSRSGTGDESTRGIAMVIERLVHGVIQVDQQNQGIKRSLKVWEPKVGFLDEVEAFYQRNIPFDPIPPALQWSEEHIFTVESPGFATLIYHDEAAARAEDNGLLAWISGSLLRTVLTALHILRFNSREFAFHVIPSSVASSNARYDGRRDFSRGGISRPANELVDCCGTLVLVNKEEPWYRPLVMLVRPPWLIGGDEMREFAKLKNPWRPASNPRFLRQHEAQPLLLQTEVFDACIANNCFFFIVTNLKQSVFGTFNSSYTRCSVSPVILRRSSHPSLMQTLTVWLLRAFDDRPRELGHLHSSQLAIPRVNEQRLHHHSTSPPDTPLSPPPGSYNPSQSHQYAFPNAPYPIDQYQIPLSPPLSMHTNPSATGPVPPPYSPFLPPGGAAAMSPGTYLTHPSHHMYGSNPTGPMSSPRYGPNRGFSLPYLGDFGGPGYGGQPSTRDYGFGNGGHGIGYAPGQDHDSRGCGGRPPGAAGGGGQDWYS